MPTVTAATNHATGAPAEKVMNVTTSETAMASAKTVRSHASIFDRYTVAIVLVCGIRSEMSRAQRGSAVFTSQGETHRSDSIKRHERLGVVRRACLIDG